LIDLSVDGNINQLSLPCWQL